MTVLSFYNLYFINLFDILMGLKMRRKILLFSKEYIIVIL